MSDCGTPFGGAAHLGQIHGSSTPRRIASHGTCRGTDLNWRRCRIYGGPTFHIGHTAGHALVRTRPWNTLCNGRLSTQSPSCEHVHDRLAAFYTCADTSCRQEACHWVILLAVISTMRRGRSVVIGYNEDALSTTDVWTCSWNGSRIPLYAEGDPYVQISTLLLFIRSRYPIRHKSNQIKSNLFAIVKMHNKQFIKITFHLAGQTGDSFALMSAHKN